MIGVGLAQALPNYVKGCGFWSVHYIEEKFVLRCLFGSEKLSIMENWMIVRSSEVRNVLKLC